MMDEIEHLNNQYGDEQVSFFKYKNFPFIKIQSPHGESLSICFYGAHVTEWIGSDGQQVLFTSSKAIFEPGKAIRGGIPVIFPQFSGMGTLQAHGFARNQMWELGEVKKGEGDIVSVTFILKNSPKTEAWPHTFETRLTYTLSKGLRNQWDCLNTGDAPFSFRCALHTYFTVEDITKTSVTGVSDCAYFDNLKNMERFIDSRPEVTFEGEVDRAYLKIPGPVSILQPNQKTIVVESTMPDGVIWNPWIEKSSKMADLQPDDWKRFVCVESGCIESPVVVEPGMSCSYSTSYRRI